MRVWAMNLFREVNTLLQDSLFVSKSFLVDDGRVLFSIKLWIF